jgi:lipoprotein NlpI
MKRCVSTTIRIRLLAIALLSATILIPRSSAQVSAEARECVGIADLFPDKAVKTCTDAINSGRLSYLYIPLVLKRRGDAYLNLQQYQLAIQDYDHVIKLGIADARVFNNRGVAYMISGDLDRSIRDFDSAIQLDSKKPYYFLNRARAQFFLGRYAIARGDFADALKREPKSAFYAIWLYICSARAGLDARSELVKNSAHINRKEWLGIMVDLYLGKVGSEEVLSAARNRDIKKEKEQLCDAYFYLAERALITGNRDEALFLLRKSVEIADSDSVMSFSAIAELRYLENH